ncbi:uncharacterized protein LOC106756565 [Vigna radiata var. radiata]|uniref:Uncharacterized protein LOC106756565 n=1 Tax=Vigna radiata var. radiata TaxID=3916 RepID=A0A1S3TLA0_VIGRR|nr:uncharacterized protein LOC106756565 [Vigna radiata var. radiata]
MVMEVDLNSQCNWTIPSSASISDTITFQSSYCLLSDDQRTDPTPLLLHSPSPDSPPCEIKITFPEKHELRQIYVRSTARVYEIYFAPNARTNNEYLCTVRCGLAVRDDHVLRSPAVQNVGGDDNVKTEDDWVEVKVPDSPHIASETKPYLNSIKTYRSQDLYEATAEIDDANPCISVTIRLLSLQNKGCVYVDEIYVFADPVDSADSESQEKPYENSSGSSLMAMFIPTLMQLSKTTGLNNLNALRKEKSLVQGDDLEATLSSDSIIKTQVIGNTSITDPQEVKLKEVEGGWVGPSQPDVIPQLAKIERNPVAVPSQTAKMDSTCTVVPSKIAEMENNHSAVPFEFAKMECNRSSVPSQVGIPESKGGFSLGYNVERLLEQLVSRMDRIEEICLGFQEKMVVPMSSMEVRLQRVEQQVDTLTKNLQNSALPSHCKIFSPDASCIESDANTSDCPDYLVTRESEPDENHLHAEIQHVSSPPNRSDSGNIPTLLPGLVVTAPEFPDGEDEEDNAPGQETSSLKDKGKHTIDDALSSALANFLSSVSMDSPKYTKSLIVKAPEFLNEDDDDDHGSSSEIAKNDSVCLAESEEFSHIQVLASSNTLENGEKINPDSNCKQSEKTAQEAEEDGQLYIARRNQEEVHVKTNSLTELNPETGFIDNSEDDDNGRINGHKGDGLLDNQTPYCYSITEEGPTSGTEDTVAREVPRKASHENILKNVLGFSVGSSAVDFENPILDVKFISQRSPATDRFLEELLHVDTQESTSSVDPSVKESNVDLSVEEQLKTNDVSVEQSNLISIDEEPANLVSESHFAVDLDSCTSIPVNIDDDNLLLPEDHKRKRDQVTWSSSM